MQLPDCAVLLDVSKFSVLVQPSASFYVCTNHGWQNLANVVYTFAYPLRDEVFI